MKLTLGVEPFNGESHTSENMLRMVLQLLEEYNLLSKTNVGLRDNASAMKAMFNLSDSQMVGLGCLIHSLQLCLEDQLLNLPSVKTLVEKSRKAAKLDYQSDKFHAELIRQQKIQLPDQEPVGLIQDVVTRSGHCSSLFLHSYVSW